MMREMLILHNDDNAAEREVKNASSPTEISVVYTNNSHETMSHLLADSDPPGHQICIGIGYYWAGLIPSQAAASAEP